MSMPLLATKLHIPPLPPNLVPRSRLVQRLAQAHCLHSKLILLSAQAGSGKTTLLSEWIQGTDHVAFPQRVAWVSLDKGDNDPLRFWSYVIAALQTIDEVSASQIGGSALAAMQAGQPPPVESALTGLINELDSVQDMVMILDDYHLIDNARVHQTLEFFLEHQAPQLQLVTASRKDPPLPLPRLRARGQLTEIRIDDLRFTPPEASSFFEGSAKLTQAPDQVASLTARTEGWIAGLQLAAIALQQQSPHQIPGFVQAFTGSNRFVLDYLIEEVLVQQHVSLQAFLLQTSIFERLSGPLCDAVVGRPAAFALDSQQVLEQLEAANLFILALDDERRWFRYHRLFADLLHARLDRDGPGLDCAPAAQVHRRASVRYDAHGYTSEAIDHALASGDTDVSVNLIEDRAMLMLTQGELTTRR